MKDRVWPALGVFAAALVCALLAMYWSPMWITTIAFWFGAVAFVWLGLRTLLGRVGAAQVQDPPWPTPVDSGANPFAQPGFAAQGLPAPPSEPPSLPAAPRGAPVAQDQVGRAAFDSGKRIVRGMSLLVVILSLLILVPVDLILVVAAIFEFRDGEIINGGIATLVAVFIAGFCWKLVRSRKSVTVLIGGGGD